MQNAVEEYCRVPTGGSMQLFTMPVLRWVRLSRFAPIRILSQSPASSIQHRACGALSTSVGTPRKPSNSTRSAADTSRADRLPHLCRGRSSLPSLRYTPFPSDLPTTRGLSARAQSNTLISRRRRGTAQARTRVSRDQALLPGVGQCGAVASRRLAARPSARRRRHAAAGRGADVPALGVACRRPGSAPAAGMAANRRSCQVSAHSRPGEDRRSPCRVRESRRRR